MNDALVKKVQCCIVRLGPKVSASVDSLCQALNEFQCHLKPVQVTPLK